MGGDKKIGHQIAGWKVAMCKSEVLHILPFHEDEDIHQNYMAKINVITPSKQTYLKHLAFRVSKQKSKAK